MNEVYFVVVVTIVIIEKKIQAYMCEWKILKYDYYFRIKETRLSIVVKKRKIKINKIKKKLNVSYVLGWIWNKKRWRKLKKIKKKRK